MTKPRGGPTHPLPIRWRSPLVPIAMLAAAAFLLCLHVAFLAGPMWETDERPHAAYTVSLLLGELPTIDTPILDDPKRFPAISRSLAGQDEAHSDIWTANHPPLYYLVSLPFVAAADWIAMPGIGLLSMRAINAAGTAACVLLIGLIARELVPRRPVIWVLATVVGLSCATVIHLGGFIFNDGLGVAASSLTVLLGLRMLNRGVSARTLTAACAAGTVAAAVRAPGVLAVVFCCAAVLLTGFQASGPRRWRRAVAASAVVGAVPALAIGWFYLRNIGLYGDVGATSALLQKFGRRSPASFVDILVDPTFYLNQFDSLWVRRFLDPRLTGFTRVIAALAGIGLIILAVRTVVRAAHRLPRADTPPRIPWYSLTTSRAWLLLGLFTIAIEVSAISFRAAGGSAHVRYLFPILPVVATVVAIGLMGLLSWLPRRWTRLRDGLGLFGFGIVLLTYASLIQLSSDGQIASRGRPAALGGVTPSIVLILGGLFAIGGLGLAIWQLLGRRDHVAPTHQSVAADPLETSRTLPSDDTRYATKASPEATTITSQPRPANS